MVKLKISREHEEVKMITKRSGDAGYDIYADPRFVEELQDKCLVIPPRTTSMIPTGIRVVMDNDWYFQIQERGSTGTKAMKYGSGVMDSNYRDVYNVVITNCGNQIIVLSKEEEVENIKERILEQYTMHPDYNPETFDKDMLWNMYIFYPIEKAIAQMVLLPVPKTEIEEVSVEDILKEKSERGLGKLGSTGK